MTEMTKGAEMEEPTGLVLGQVWELPFDAPGALGWVVAATRVSSTSGASEALILPLDGEDTDGNGEGVIDASGDRAVALVGALNAQGLPSEHRPGAPASGLEAPSSGLRKAPGEDLDDDSGEKRILAERAVLRAGLACWVPREDLWFRTPLELAPAHARELGARANELAKKAEGSAIPKPTGAPQDQPALDSAVQLGRWLERERIAAVLATGAAQDERDVLALAASSGDVLGDLVAESGPEAAAYEVRWRGAGVGLDELRWTLELERGEYALDCSERPERLVRLGHRGGRTFVPGSPRLVGGWRSMWLPVEAEGERMVFERAGRLVEVRWSWPGTSDRHSPG